MSLLEINHMKKSFGEVEVLKDISMKVEEGEVFGIIGPSGSGKSTARVVQRDWRHRIPARSIIMVHSVLFSRTLICSLIFQF